MLPDDPQLKAVESRLLTLVKCVLAKAEADAEFAEQLKQLLLSDNLRAAVGMKGNKKKRHEVFDPVAYLSQHNVAALQQHLAARPTSELTDIARKQRLASPKAIKGMERNDLITKLVAHAQRRLDQGTVFFGEGKPERQSSPPRQPESETGTESLVAPVS